MNDAAIEGEYTILTANKVPPNIAPPTSNFCNRVPFGFCTAAGCCMYDLDPLNAFPAFTSVLTGDVLRDVKKVFVGLLE